jgi:hypothetical protein
VAEETIATGSPQPLIEFFFHEVQSAIVDRVDRLADTARQRDGSVRSECRYVEEMLWAAGVVTQALSDRRSAPIGP